MIKQAIAKVLGPTNVKLLRSTFKTPEEKEMMKKRAAFYGQFLKKGDTYFDIGANYVNRIEPILPMGIKVVAVEPQKQCYTFLERKFGNKINIVKKGLGEKNETKTFYSNPVSEISSFSKEWIESVKESGRFGDNEWVPSGTLEMTTFDDVIKKYGTPRFAKIDVEGFELEVLKGLSSPVDNISIEYTVPEQTDRTIACIKRIMQINGAVECNYSVGESMEWATDKWRSGDEMVAFVVTKEFAVTGFGDIYIRRKKG
jgi:FkbM family methyltransferase